MNKKTKHILCIIAITALALATVILGVRVHQLSTDNRNEFQKYYDMKTEAFAVNNLNAAEGQIVFLGDSITDLCPLDKYYNDLTLAAYNRGIGGDTTSGLLKRLDISALNIKPSKIVILIGANDINAGISQEDIVNNHKQILDKITERLPETEIYLMSLIPQNKDIEEYAEIDVAENTKTLMSINEKLKELHTKYEKATYIDLFSALEDENHFLKKEYSDDGIHLNAKGFEVWVEILKPYLQ